MVEKESILVKVVGDDGDIALWRVDQQREWDAGQLTKRYGNAHNT